MKKLEITKGTFVLDTDATNGMIAEKHRSKGVGIAIADENNEYWHAAWVWNDYPKSALIPELFTNAGNTYNETGLLPSELLKQNKELREALQVTVTQLNNYAQVWGYDESKAVEKAEQALNSKP